MKGTDIAVFSIIGRCLQTLCRVVNWRLSAVVAVFLTCTLCLPAGVIAGRPVVRPEAALVRLLTSPPSSWSRPLATQFAKTIPGRFIEALATQSNKTIRYFVANERLPKTGLQDEYFCWASVGRGGGYAAFIHRDDDGYKTVWDSLLPPTFISPHVEFLDVNGDSALEILCSGPRLYSDLYEWTILGWDGTQGRVLAPRLDQPGRDISYNRLIGRALKITDTPGSAAKTLILTLGNNPGDSTVVADSAIVTRAFLYDKTLDGFLPPP